MILIRFIKLLLGIRSPSLEVLAQVDGELEKFSAYIRDLNKTLAQIHGVPKELIEK
jgi:hypothetical protein